MRTLIVEDDTTNSFLLESFLSTFGFCQVVDNGKEAVKAFRVALEGGQPYDLICMDVVMPTMDGHQSVRMIRALERNRKVAPESRAKIIMTTALSDRGNVIQSAREECDAFILKPIDTGRLMEHLKNFGLVK
jgi:two-component system chemotaxis response regulator CheY